MRFAGVRVRAEMPKTDKQVAERQFAVTVERGAAGSRFVKYAVTTT